MKKYTKWCAALVAAIMVIGVASPALAAEDISQKEEVIYVVMDGNGAAYGVYVVNSFAGGNITDYGNYKEVKMLTSETPINQSGDTITFSDQSEKAYYEGIMDASTPMPWNISIRYFLDGREYSPAEIAGKSGKLDIRFQVSKNAACQGSFFEDYALQATFLLDSDSCANIAAQDATVANVGSKKQLSYTILPGKGIDTVITADVADFEMDAVTINGVRLSLDVDFDDQELMDEIGKLIDATVKVDDGAISVRKGTVSLKSGGSEVTDGAAALEDGTDSLSNGISDLQAGIISVQAGLNQLTAQSGALIDGSSKIKEALSQIQTALQSISVSQEQISALTKSSAAIKDGLTQLSDGAAALQSALSYSQYKNTLAQNGLDIDALKAGNAQAASDIGAQIASIQAMINSLDESDPAQAVLAEQLRSQIGQLESVATLLSGNNAAIGGTESYFGGISGAADSLYAGVSSLQTQYTAFDSAISELATTLTGMLSKMAELTAGVNQIVAEYDKLDGGLRAYFGGVSQLSDGYVRVVDGISALAAGSKELQEGAGALNAGTKSLYDGLITLCEGTSELAGGTSEMRDQVSGMDTTADEKINEALSAIEGGNAKTMSFVSDKNTNIASVQFAIKTDAITVQTPDSTEAASVVETTFWQKFLKLFGIE